MWWPAFFNPVGNMETKVSAQMITGHWCIAVITVLNYILKKNRDCIYILSAETELQTVWWIKKIKRAIRIYRTERHKVAHGWGTNLRKSNFLSLLEINTHSTSSTLTATLEWDLKGQCCSLIITARVVLCCYVYILTVAHVRYRYLSKGKLIWCQIFYHIVNRSSIVVFLWEYFWTVEIYLKVSFGQIFI